MLGFKLPTCADVHQDFERATSACNISGSQTKLTPFLRDKIEDGKGSQFFERLMLTAEGVGSRLIAG